MKQVWLLIGLMCSLQIGWGQGESGLAFGAEIIPAQPLIQLEKGWQHEGRNLDVPFQLQVKGTHSLEIAFTLPPNPADTLMLYIPGMLGQAEVLLNEMYLGLGAGPLEPWIRSIPLSWFRQNNILRLDMRPGATKMLAPQAQIGLVEALLVLDPCDTADIRRQIMKRVPRADSVAILAASYPTDKIGFDPFWASRALLVLKERDIQHVYFPFEPGRRMRAMCARMGLTEVQGIEDSTRVAWINAYPYEAAFMPGKAPFWLDGKGRVTAEFGRWQTGLDHHPPPMSHQTGWLLAMLVLAPFLGLFLVKWLMPGFWGAQRMLLRKPQLFLEGSSEGGYSQSGALFFLILGRWLSVWAFGSLFLYGVIRLVGLPTLQTIRPASLLLVYLNWADSLGMIMLTFGMILLTWLALKAIGLLFLSAVFRIKNLWSGSLSIEVVGSYPLVFLLPIAAAFFLFSGIGASPWVLLLLLILWGIYFARRMYVIYTGLDRLFSFSYGMKFLYICTLNLIPYIIWL